MTRKAFAPGAHVIEAYGKGGFRFAGMSHVGSILATPKGVSAVAAASVGELGVDDLARLIAELEAEPGVVEYVVIGTGETMRPAPAPLAAQLRARKIGFEAMATGPASRIYNVMIDEGRRVAALLIAAP
ncbi:MAG: Mth938-like domain-containing protein [Roseiarcus sp.]